MSDYSNPASGDDDDWETFAALDAIEGRGIRVRKHADRAAEDLLQEFEAAAGAIFAAWPRSDSVPAPTKGFQGRLERFLLSQASLDDPLSPEDFAGPRSVGPQSTRSIAPPTGSPTGARRGGATEDRDSGRSGLLGVAGWLIAAGLLAFVLTGGLGRSGSDAGPSETQLGQQFDQFVAAGHSVDPWQALDGKLKISGGVVWDDESNEGFMKIAGLAANDPTAEQYQLWIFRTGDPESEPHPIDGGVFDVPSSGEVIIPIDAKLSVGHASIFAVTVEEPGGVVVSDRSGLTILAKSTS